MTTERSRLTDSRNLVLPFGYYVEWDEDLLILRRSDCSFVVAFSAGCTDPFEVEAAVWEDAD